MSLPSMTVPSMSGPIMTGAPMLCGSLPGAPGSLQPFPLAYEATPTSAGMFGQPAYVPMQAYMPGMASSMAYPHASVPVVGITPSQMVANAFSAGGTSAGAKAGVLGGGGGIHHHGFPAQAFGAPPAVNGLSHHAPVSSSSAQNGAGNGGCGNGGWPQEALLQPAATTASVVAGDAEHFEAKWAALEAKQPAAGAGSQQAKVAPNPFSSELQKTFEIEL